MLVNLESFDHHADFGTAQGSLYTESSEPVADLQLFIFDRNDEGPIELRLAYHPKRYTALQAHQHLVNIAQLTKLVPHYGQESIASLSLLDPSQRAGIIEASDGPTQDLSAQPLTLAALFAAQVAASPRAPALIFEQSMGEHASMDFAELDARSNQLARHLISLGCGPDHIVAVLLDRSPQLIVAMLAILKAGAAYLPLDPELPTSRLQFMLADSQTRLLLSSSHHLEQLDSAPTRVDSVDLSDARLSSALSALPATEIEPQERTHALDPANLAYLIYTSGSTGTPKGAGNTHQAVVNRLIWMQDTMQLASRDRVLQKTAIGFDVAVWEWFLPLMTGAALVIARPEGQKDPTYLKSVIEQHHVSVMHFVPSMLAVFLESLEAQDCPSLKQIVTSGEALSGAVQAQTFRQLPQTRLWNLYGPTEAAIDVSVWPCRQADETLTPPIGYPIWNTQLFILDHMLEPLPHGVVGELYIAGTNLARGYLGRSGLTAERFIACPFATKGARMYRTGDLARRREDGAIEYLGRADDQVKIRGYRIELGEIQACLLAQHPSLAQAEVITRNIQGDQRLVAYLVARHGQEAAQTEVLRNGLLASLPEYMVPSYFVYVPVFPLSANGKLDRRALPDPEIGRVSETYRAPRNDSEDLLCKLFAEITGAQQVSIDDGFFALGGHSLLAMRLLARLQAETGKKLSLRTLFDCLTPERLAPHLDASAQDQGPVLVEGMGRIDTNTVTLSYGQSRLWTLDRVEGPSATYNMAVAIALEGALDIEALRASLVAVIDRHQPLRTVLTEDADGSPIGRLLNAPSKDDVLSIVDFSQAFQQDPLVAQHQLDAWVTEQAACPFDLEHDQPFRAYLAVTQPQRAVLTLTMHHHAGDGISSNIIAKDLEYAYLAYQSGSHPNWTALPVQYADWAMWQQQSLQPVLEAKIERAKKRLVDIPEMLTLPVDHPRTAQRAHRAGYLPVCIPANTVKQLEQLAHDQGTTLFTLMLAAYAAMLSRLAGQQEVVIGAPVAGRSQLETEELVGLLVNTLAVPISTSGLCSGNTLIQRTIQAVAAALDDQDLPFEKLVEGLNVNRSFMHTPIFQAMLAYQTNAVADFKFNSIISKTSPIHLPTAKFDLILFIGLDEAGNLAGNIEYDADLFECDTVTRWIRYLQNLTTSLASNPDKEINALRLTDRRERDQLIASASGETHELSSSLQTLASLFTAQATLTPLATALMIEHDHQLVELSYAELDARSNQLARYLIQQGIGPDQVIAVLLNRSTNLIVAMLGILKAGAAYLPIDPELPPSRLSYILNDCQAKYVITQQEYFNTLPASDIAQPIPVYLDDALLIPELKRLSDQAITQLERVTPLLPEHLAYLIYTSGSTGLPKGTGNEHDAIVNHMEWVQSVMRLSANDRVLQKTAIGFDVAVWEWFLPLMTGATLVIAKPDGHKDPAYLKQMIEKYQVTTVHFVASMLGMFVEELESHDCQSIRQIITSGEALSGVLQAQTFERFPTIQLWDFYGPTEAAIHVAQWLCRAQDGLQTPPIGHPIWNIQLHILDKLLEPVPNGIVGELYIAGRGLARGYTGRPSLTAERFIANPFSASGARMYRTGDLARRRHDGAIEYLGRADDQVKIRGYRIELGEIETTLREQFESISQVAVIAKKINDEQRLVAYLVPRSGSDLPDVNTLRLKLLTILPDYMLPTYFVNLDRLPLNTNGKLDRRALPEPSLDSNSVSFREPRTEQEKFICTLFAEITGYEKVGLDDSFFAIGGHSLLAMRLVAKIRQQTGLTLGLRTLFEFPTPERLAPHLDTSAQDQGPALVEGMGRIDTNTVALSYGQSRLWTLDRVEGPSATYNMAVAIVLEGALDIGALRASLVAIIARHQPLRTVMTEDAEGLPIGRLLNVPSKEAILSIVDFSQAFQQDSLAAQSKLESWVGAEAGHPFDLEHDLPFRAHLAVTHLQRAVLSLTMHHHAGDGISSNIIAKDLEYAYLAYQSGSHPKWSALTVQYADWAMWQQQSLQPVLEAKIERAKKRLVEMPEMLTLPVDHPRTAQRAHRAGYLPISITANTVQQLEALAQEQGTTLFTVMLAAYAATLSRLAGQQEVVIGAPIAGRNHASADHLVGFFLNTLALPISLNGECSGHTLISRATRSFQEALEDQDLPFERLLEGLNLSRSMLNTPVFQAMFAFQSDAIPAFHFEHLVCRSQAVPLPTSKFDLTLHLSKENDGSLQGDFEFDQDLFDQTTVERWVQAFLSITTSLCHHPEQYVAQYPLMDIESQIRLIQSNAGQELVVDSNYLVFTHAFEEQAKRTPEAIALICGEEMMSYKELDHASNQLARYLLKQGTQTDQIIGILIDRSPNMIISILAILKAGAAYLPLDANYPTERLYYMLSDSGAIGLLCTRNTLEILNTDVQGHTLPPTWMIDDINVRQQIQSYSTARLSDSERTAPISPDNLVYVMYTSGSTGRPKGVSFLHGSLGNLVNWKEHVLPAQVPRVLQYSPVGFDASAQEIASAFCSGATLILIDEQSRKDSRALLEHIQVKNVDHLYTPFVVLSSLAETRNAFNIAAWPKDIFTAGEQLQITPEIRSAFLSHPESRLHNFYGPTEAHVVSNYSMPADPKDWIEFPPIGIPIDNTQLYILDSSLNLVPDGTVGELYIAGMGLARGYLGKAGMTAEKFIACPFTELGARMYRTGDLARRQDGQIFYLGRVDDQVKLRGYRIEMGEIEAALLKHFDCFSHVAVIAREVNHIKTLVAYYVALPQQPCPKESELKARLARFLPDYMVPSYYLEVEKLPLTPNGKLDRRALPLPVDNGDEKAYRAPVSANEILLCTLFSEITGTQTVSVDDSFFGIGGHSLLAMRLIAKLRSLHGKVLPLRTLFEYTTPETLAPHLETLEDDEEPMLIRGSGRITEN
jgi:amino acid adenylation domain-containing protein